MLDFVLLDASVTTGNPIQQYILIGGMLLVFYFFMVRPQQRRKREQFTFLENIKKGDHVVTIGGIHGKVYDVSDGTLTLEIDSKGSKITVARGAISPDSTKKHRQKK
ncbi:MAG: preprotein translocase subunit YajC [Amoebophilaceae bacterium]|jgi:preprotein translocase subunit YajC|nr:preprotein translocase subunit YajC [Amoebophilaceae bacterium]